MSTLAQQQQLLAALQQAGTAPAALAGGRGRARSANQSPLVSPGGTNYGNLFTGTVASRGGSPVATATGATRRTSRPRATAVGQTPAGTALGPAPNVQRRTRLVGRSAQAVPVNANTPDLAQLANPARSNRYRGAESPFRAVTQANRLAGQHGRRPTSAYRTGATVGPVGAAAAAGFLAANGAICGNTSEQDIADFINAVDQTLYTGQNLTSIIDVIAARGQAAPDRSLKKKSRFAGGAFADVTYGLRGVAGAKPAHSLLWQIALDNCAILPQITQDILNVQNGTYIDPNAAVPAVTLDALIQDPATLQEINDEAAAFVAAHPNKQDCAATEDQVRTFLGLVDAFHLTGNDVFDLAQVTGLEGWGPLVSQGSWRWAGGVATPQTHGVTDATYSQIKFSLLWYVLTRFCNNLDYLNNVLEQVVLGAQQGGALANYQPLGIKNNPALYNQLVGGGAGGLNAMELAQ